MVAPKNQAIKYYRKYTVYNENLEIESPGISRDRIFLTYNSPDTDKISETRIMLEEKGLALKKPGKILHLGRLVKWKRVDLLIEAISHLYKSHDYIELSIIGSGPEEENLKRMARMKLPEGAVKFHGAIYDSEELAGEIISSAVYVLGGMGGLSINEAMAYGLPVICSRCDGTERDLISDGHNGLFFKEGDADDLASKIETLLRDPDKSQANARPCRYFCRISLLLQTFSQCEFGCA
ncbi:MAG: glycosyltransferase family 4 protein [Bacteroidales bacterium]